MERRAEILAEITEVQGLIAKANREMDLLKETNKANVARLENLCSVARDLAAAEREARDV
jgi:hypothetical protein